MLEHSRSYSAFSGTSSNSLAIRVLINSVAKADTIDVATFDPKAVNQRARVARDARSPLEILAAIEGHGWTVQAALTRLRMLLQDGGDPAKDQA
ncbi:MAG TPA: hypothetical protein VLA99_09075 [Nitrospiraceae bacterium]|nr:hypothetical protein [Nitrospiraceae bacterium]